MLFHSGLDAGHLIKMLAGALAKEQTQWKQVHYRSNTGTAEVGGIHRDETVSWLISINSRFHFTPETVALSVAILDRILSLVRVRPKYIQCVAVSCFYIAAKTLEEDEVIPSTVDLVKVSQCGCAVSDILRMEMIILNKLQWSVKTVTQIDYLQIIHSLLMCYYPQLLDAVVNMTPSRHLSILSRNIFHCLCNHKMVGFRPITLTLAIVSLELEQITPAWLSIIHTVQHIVDVEIDTFIRCRDFAVQILKEKNLFTSRHHLQFCCTMSGSQVPRSFKRKADFVNIEDDVYDGLEHLYNEDVPSTKISSCSSEVGRDHGVQSVVTFTQTKPVCAN